MKRTLLILALMITSIMANAQQTPEQRAKLEAKHGIRDIKLGTHLSEFNGLIKLGEGKFGAGYKKENENLLIGDVKASDIKYIFYDDILCAIIIEIRSGVDTKKIKKVLFDLYGKPNDERWTHTTWYAESFQTDLYEYSDSSQLTYELNSYEEKLKEIKSQKLQKLKNDL